MKKTILLSLMASSLLAEDDGVFMSVGYQIGEAAQMVKNTGEIQKVSRERMQYFWQHIQRHKQHD